MAPSLTKPAARKRAQGVEREVECIAATAWPGRDGCREMIRNLPDERLR